MFISCEKNGIFEALMDYVPIDSFLLLSYSSNLKSCQ